MPVDTPSPVATTPPPAQAIDEQRSGGWLWWLVAAGVVVAGLGTWFWSRRRPAEPDWAPAAEEEIADPLAEVAAAPEPAAPTAPAPRAPGGLVTSSLRPELTIALRPVEAAIDTLRGTVEFALTIANTGRAAAGDVTVEAWLLGAGSNPREDRAAALAGPPGQPLTEPFGLPPAARVDVPGQGTLERDHIPVITAGDRKLFVPMVVVRARYRDAGGRAHEANAAFLIGAERAGAARLAPLALDRGTRNWRTLDARVLEG